MVSREILISADARERMLERGASEAEVSATIAAGETFPAKLNRVGFRRNFASSGLWRGRQYATKQLEVLAVEEAGRWIVVTVVVKYF
jgi:hypothetical protein